MFILKLALLALPLATGVLSHGRISTSNRYPSTDRYPAARSSHHRKSKSHHSRKYKKPSNSYFGPGQYLIENVATGTALDLYLGNPGPDTTINAYAPTITNEHQIWHIVAADANKQVLIINSATGAIASCPTEANENGLLQLTGGEVAIDGNALFTLISNSDKSVQFQNVADPDLCLDVQDSSVNDGTPIICYPCHPDVGENQNWNLVPAGSDSSEEL
ncbi:uncharacterized protein PAC_16379 [Phialocephala subalpina]|uniref:Ricin B lectin domain-containing protein n=1 Tax=Phialocephala subalpina TaxID=576137 RepID=A0A1L7XN80_9HELO|nr:uncharacterized protein PAC_16379 [Phialocephala subalpina]